MPVPVLIREVSAAELDQCASVLRRSFATVAEEFGLTRDNCPTNAAFIDTSRLVRFRERGHRQYGAFLVDDPATMVGFFALWRRSASVQCGADPGRADPPAYELKQLELKHCELKHCELKHCESKQHELKHYELKKLAVLPEYRHAGIGRALLDFAVATVRSWGGTGITIAIIEENTRLKNWYAAYGFVATGTKTVAHLPFTVGLMQLPVSGAATVCA